MSGLRTYFAHAVVAGGSGGGNKDMLSLLNPSASGVTMRVRKIIAQCLSSGNNVIVTYELQDITAHTAGTAVTIRKHDSADSASAAESYAAPASVTGGTVIWNWSLQANTSQAPNTYVWRFGEDGVSKPLVLREGEGFLLHQPTANNGDFALTFVWTEE